MDYSWWKCAAVVLVGCAPGQSTLSGFSGAPHEPSVTTTGSDLNSDGMAVVDGGVTGVDRSTTPRRVHEGGTGLEASGVPLMLIALARRKLGAAQHISNDFPRFSPLAGRRGPTNTN